MKTILNEFKNYCTDPSIPSGKASSYAKAIEYLCDFLEITELNSQTIEQIENSKNFISDKNSRLYKELLLNLSINKRKSYLENGYIKAAIPQFINFYNIHKANKQITKVQAIEKVIELCGGSATWDEIYSKTEIFYPDIKSSKEWKAGIRGVLYRELRNNKSFERNIDGSFSLIKNSNSDITQLPEEIDKNVLELLDNNVIDTKFDCDKLLGILPTTELYKHRYNISSTNGTVKSSINKVYSGRKAEKYFINFLKHNQFIENKDFYDVANDKNYGFDVKFFNIGLEIKNIKSASFYLTDNEIAHIESNKTILVLVDIDNGIWVLGKNSVWLKDVINCIKEIREYSSVKYPTIDLTDIKINIDKKLEEYSNEISQLNHDEIYNTIVDCIV